MKKRRSIKLITKLSILYIVLAAIVLLSGSFYVYKNVLKETYYKNYRISDLLVKRAITELKTDIPSESIDYVYIKEISYDEKVIPFSAEKKVVKQHRGRLEQMHMQESVKIHGKHYLVESPIIIIGDEDVAEGVFKSIGLMFLFLITLLIITVTIFSGRILRPFHYALKNIREFRMQDDRPIEPMESNTKEFNELNQFLTEMTGKIISDYRSLKEFTENASHELQTPLAVMRSKTELLMNSGINEKQAELTISIYNAIEQLSKINKSLSLLTKLENNEFGNPEKVDFSLLCQQSISSMEEIILMKDISLVEDIEIDVFVHSHPVMAEILLNNLLWNSINHNIPGGKIEVLINSNNLNIRNTGKPLEIPPEQLFQRFKKADQSANSTGLGLSIVQQICKINNWNIKYLFLEPDIHSIEIWFDEKSC